jgi:hypothetical protein
MKNILETCLSKRTLADRDQVGIRTIEAWHAAGLKIGVRQGRRLQFDPFACDTALLAYMVSKHSPLNVL